MILLRFTLLLVFFLYAVNTPVRGMDMVSMENQEQALISKLFKNYKKNQKPDETVGIKFALNLNQIVSIKSKDQIFNLNVFLDHEWTDQRLKWDPKENGNITMLKIASENLWTPDTFVYTTADTTGFLLPQKGAYFVVGNDGKIFWPNPLPQMAVRCSMAISWFPYDDQLCTIVFGSWSNTMSYLNYSLMNEESALAGYQENSEWSLVEYKGYRIEVLYDNWIEKDPFSEIHYKIHIRRKPLFVLQNYCIPALMLCIITLCTFYMPFAQQMQLGIAVMLTFSILKLKLSDDVPSQSDSIPLFNIYFTACMVSALVSMFWYYQKNLFCERKALPKWMRWLLLKVFYPIIRRPAYLMIKVDKPSNEDGEEEKKRVEYTDMQLVPIWNQLVFWLFCLYFFLLNTVLLIILPVFVKVPLEMSSS